MKDQAKIIITKNPPTLDNVLCLDFEASTIGYKSYPIEVGITDVMTMASHSWLIRPTENWLRTGIWSPESAAVHKIPQSLLLAEGLHPARVTDELAALCRGKIVLSDARNHDGAWLNTLYAAIAVIKPPFELEHFSLFAEELAAVKGKDAKAAIESVKAEALKRFPILHRAGPDSQRNAEMLRLIAEE